MRLRRLWLDTMTERKYFKQLMQECGANTVEGQPLDCDEYLFRPYEIIVDGKVVGITAFSAFQDTPNFQGIYATFTGIKPEFRGNHYSTEARKHRLNLLLIDSEIKAFVTSVSSPKARVSIDHMGIPKIFTLHAAYIARLQDLPPVDNEGKIDILKLDATIRRRAKSDHGLQHFALNDIIDPSLDAEAQQLIISQKLSKSSSYLTTKEFAIRYFIDHPEEKRKFDELNRKNRLLAMRAAVAIAERMAPQR